MSIPWPNVTLYPVAEPSFILTVKVLTGVTSCLSILGASVIILTYMCCGGQKSFHWRRSPLRQVVVMLSVADIIVGISHIWGISQGLEKYMPVYYGPNGGPPDDDTPCIAQAALAVYGTMASFMWSFMLVFLVCCVSALPGAHWLDRVSAMIIYQFVCWGAPLLLVILLASNSLLGFGEGSDIGWCFISLRNITSEQSQRNALIFGYELWLWALLLLIIIFSIAFLVVGCLRKYCCEQTQEEQTEANASLVHDSFASTTSVQSGRVTTINHLATGGKFVLAAILLILLRLFNTILDIVLLGSPDSYRELWVAVIVAFGAVGDSAQGFVNFFIFVLITPQFLEGIKKCWQKQS